jgi:small subunit ribosomal protein S9
MTQAEDFIWATGKRKSSAARVRIKPGTGKIFVNNKPIEDYFGRQPLRALVRQPLVVTDNEGKFDIFATINGGGSSGQAEALRHGISRALLTYNTEFKPSLKKDGLLTRDPREKERRKVGCRKARRRPQYSKR